MPCFRSGSVVQVETTLLGLAKQGALQEKTGRYSLSTLYLAMPKTTVHVVDSMVTTPAHVAKASCGQAAELLGRHFTRAKAQYEKMVKLAKSQVVRIG